MNFDNWKLPKEMPNINEYFIAKRKNSDEFIFGQIISKLGWLACPYVKNCHYWKELKLQIEYWYPVKEIGQ